MFWISFSAYSSTFGAIGGLFGFLFALLELLLSNDISGSWKLMSYEFCSLLFSFKSWFIICGKLLKSKVKLSSALFLRVPSESIFDYFLWYIESQLGNYANLLVILKLLFSDASSFNIKLSFYFIIDDLLWSAAF